MSFSLEKIVPGEETGGPSVFRKEESKRGATSQIAERACNLKFEGKARSQK
jgi:hypothetical protein